jgi:lipopolysaccharide export system permease protein
MLTTMLLFRYILREHLSPFIYGLSVITFLFVMDFIVQMIDSILSKGLDPFIILEIFILNLAWIVALSVPMAVLVATLMAYGRLSSDNEIVALKAAGVNMYRLIFPALAASAAVAGGLVYFNNQVLPEANHRASMLYMDISRKRPSAFIKEGFVIDDFKGYKIIIGHVEPKTGEMFDIKIYQEEEGATTLTFARMGLIDYINHGEVIRFTLFDGENHRQDAQHKGDYFRGTFRRQVIYIDNIDDSFRRSKEKVRGDREMSSQMMLREVAKYRRQKNEEAGKIAVLFKDEKPAGASPPAQAFDYGGVPPRVYREVLSEEQRRLKLLARRANIVLSKKQIIAKYMVEVHKKYSIPVACLVFVLIGAPLGIMARSSGIGVGAAYSIAFFVIYWIFLIGGEALADKLIIPAWLSMWAPNMLIGGLGVWLVVKLVRETTFYPYEIQRKAARLARRVFSRVGRRLGFFSE